MEEVNKRKQTKVKVCKKKTTRTNRTKMTTKTKETMLQNKNFEPLSFYINLAKKTISKFAPKFYNGLSVEMLKSEEAISDIATALMYADWRYDENRKGKTGLQKTLYSYRNQCAIWAIKTYVTNKYRQHKVSSLDFELEDDTFLDSTIKDNKAQSPLDIVIDNEYTDNLSKCITNLLDNNLLSDKQKKQIQMYYFEDKTLSEIGKEFGVSREAVRQNIKRGLETIKSYDTVNT
jgi:RNA polymerase sigma factor (sigma-70 family)